MLFISIFGIIVLLGDLFQLVTCDCSTPLISRAKLSASSVLSNDRSADHVQLNSAGWTAHLSDFGQYLLIDLKEKYTIESISTKGRDYTNEYVQEYKIEYGNDGDFTSYRDKNGNVKVPYLTMIKIFQLTNSFPFCLLNLKITHELSIKLLPINRSKEHSSWTSGIGNFLQTLDINLGNVHKLTSIDTFGRQLSNEFVSEYRLLASDDGVYWRMYLINGVEKLFEGNHDGETIKTNYFETPIIAQYIRINPTRWGDRISMRIELYGCDYFSESINLDGKSYVMMNLKNRLISSNEEVIRFRFRTSRSNGLFLYSKGTQKDVLLLKLENNKLVLNLRLGPNEETNVVSAGSLLDNDLWHDVMISRRFHDIFFTVDRVLVKFKLKSDFPRLDLNNEMLIGGIPMSLGSQIDVQANFTGCLENLMLNSSNIIKEIKEDNNQYQSQFTRVGDILYTCRFDQITPITFNTYDSHIKIDGFFQPSINCSFDFRTFNEEGVLLQHKFSSPGFFLLYLSKGKLLLQIKGTDTPADPIIIDPFPTSLFNDGSFHTVVIYLDKDRIHIKVDDNPSETKRKFSMQSGLVYLIGGGVHGKLGFIGCMRYISIQNRFISLKSLASDKIVRNDQKDILIDACQMADRCNPNPCEHNGVCKQNHLDFTCDCSSTQYSGSVCRVAKNPISCEHYKIDYPGSKNARILIDIDGSGPLEPFKVECNFLNNEITQTILHHRSEHTKQVQGYNQPGSYVDKLIYDAAFEQITMLVNNSYNCKQHLRYDCFNARLLNSPYLRETPFTPFTYWMSRNNQKMDYWGGSLPGTRKCACGLYGTCKDSRNWCNCDSSSLTNEWFTDEGELTEKDYLPVSEIHVGDTGQSISSNRMAKYTIGPLVCEGDSLLNNVITFRYDDATIELPMLDMQHSADIYLQFKTTTETGVLIHSKGPNDFIKLSITSSKSMQFSFDIGNGPQDVEVQTAYRINDNGWHSVLVEKNKKEARLVIDGKFVSDVKTFSGQIIRPFHLTSRIVIGATIDEREGYVGCLRSLMLNGNFIDLVGMARERRLYGINTGCSGRCESNPCLNNGTCIERYSSYSCDCQWTAFKGPICADEIGVNLRSDNYIRYDFETTISTIEEHIRVGFTTIEHRGLIFGVSSYSGEYLNLIMSTSGNLRLVFDFGFERQEIIIRNENFVLGQHHDITIKRSEKGSKITIYVDNYEPIVHTFNIGAKADAQFNKLKSIYIGRNETMDSGQGFIGCISRVSFDDHFPLRRLFQENKRDNVRAYPDQDSVREDTCGIESVTHPPDFHESKPPPTGIAILVSDETSFAMVFLSVVLALILLALIVFVTISLSGTFISRQKGDYVTNEDKGARDAYDPDMAVINGKTGSDVIKKQEYFI